MEGPRGKILVFLRYKKVSVGNEHNKDRRRIRQGLQIASSLRTRNPRLVIGANKYVKENKKSNNRDRHGTQSKVCTVRKV